MPVSSTPSKRVALAPVNVNVASPLQSFKNRHSTNSASSLPLTPSLTPKFALVKSMSSLAPSCSRGAVAPAAKARKLESFSEYKITHSRNVRADLAATKLKLRLQLAFYKLKSSRDAAMASSPNIRVSKIRSQTSLQTESRRPPSFTSSANVNLQIPKSRSRGPKLSAVASKKLDSAASAMADKNAENPASSGAAMKLYHIKPSSAFYNTYPNRLPLTNTHSQRLPPVHKILRTPIKTASRVLSQMGHANNANNANQAHAVSASDETIDETADEGGDQLKKKTDMLGSSPLRYSSFGTPNSFSVAKSLLQLGSGFY